VSGELISKYVLDFQTQPSYTAYLGKSLLPLETSEETEGDTYTLPHLEAIC
jgi:hypothetical protein